MFKLTYEHEMLKETIQKFVEKEYPPKVAREIDEKEIYPWEVLAKLAKLDLTGLTIPEEYGGVGRDILAATIVCEELARRSLVLAWTYVECVFFGGENIRHFGNEGQKRYYLPKIANGELIFSYALTEPNAGSDTAAVQTLAVRHGDSYLINGAKMFISGASQSDFMIVLARTDREAPKHKGITMFIVDTKTPGLTTRPIKKIGCHGSDTREVVFEDVAVPAENILGGPDYLNRGWQQLLGTLDVEHAHLAAEGVGVAQGAFEEALRYVKQREQFGRPIGSFQVIQHMLAEMATEIQAARAFTYWLAQMAQDERPCWMEGAMAKYYATEIAKKVALQSLQIHGGYGYSMEYDIQRYVRDSLVLTIGGGTTEIQKNIIAKGLGL